MRRLILNATILLADMRYVHEVLNEAGHLGLDEESAGKIHTVLRRRIAALEAEVADEKSTAHMPNPLTTDVNVR